MSITLKYANLIQHLNDDQFIVQVANKVILPSGYSFNITDYKYNPKKPDDYYYNITKIIIIILHLLR